MGNTNEVLDSGILTSSDRLYNMCYKEALENTQIMDIALEFKRIRKK